MPPTRRPTRKGPDKSDPRPPRAPRAGAARPGPGPKPPRAAIGRTRRDEPSGPPRDARDPRGSSRAPRRDSRGSRDPRDRAEPPHARRAGPGGPNHREKSPRAPRRDDSPTAETDRTNRAGRPNPRRGERPRPLSARTKPLTREQKRPATRPEAPIDLGPGVRLQRVLAAAGIGSRRRCEELITEGRVKVNGRVVDRLPAWVEPTEDTIEVEGHVLPRPEAPVYVMLYKPRRTMCTLSDPEGRRTVADLVRHPTGARIYPVGRLDYDTMGLLLLTNDGEIANRLTHARYRISKTYRALVKGSLTDESVADLERRLQDQEKRFRRAPRNPRRAAPRTADPRPEPADSLSLRLVKAAPDKAVIDLTLTDAPSRPVEEMLDAVGLRVKKLVRVRVGPLRLTTITLGNWRDLSREEIRDLRVACGLERAPRGGFKPARSKAGAARAARKPRLDPEGFHVIMPGDALTATTPPDDRDEALQEGAGVW